MKKILFLGDSITDCSRLWMPEYHGLGNGYVQKLAQAFSEADPPIHLINKGHDGFTVPWLLRILERDCLSHHPDLVSVLIGINDIAVAHHGEVSIQEQDFAGNYDLLLKRLREGGISRILLFGPFLFPKPLFYQTWIPDVSFVEQIQKKAAMRYRIPYFPLHEQMNRFASHYGMDAITTDGIHLTDLGHQLLSELWMDAFSR